MSETKQNKGSADYVLRNLQLPRQSRLIDVGFDEKEIKLQWISIVSME
jgi:hypothetical protein